MPTWAAIVLGFIGSAGFWATVQFLISRYDKNKGIDKTLKKLEKDSCRMQLLLLISDYPHEKQEIMTLAKYYFEELDGNWYASSIFRAWLKSNEIPEPIWFEKKNNEKGE